MFPATVISGDEDPLMPPEVTAANAARFDDVRVVPCDHFLPYRMPGALADLVLETFHRSA
jgi:pimeloyl-ACP methyl ester carboxylesterase